MSAQPLNTDITIRRTLRSYRNNVRHESVAALIKRLRPMIMSIPGNEVLVGVVSRDTSVADFSPYMGEARYGASRGFPIVVGLNAQVSFSNAQTNLPDVDFAFQIGQDQFIHNTAATLATADLHSDARDLVGDV